MAILNSRSATVKANVSSCGLARRCSVWSLYGWI